MTQNRERPDKHGLPQQALGPRGDEAMNQIAGLVRSNMNVAEMRDLADRLQFPDYGKVLGACQANDIEPDDVLVFLGAMTDKQGHAVDRQMSEVANFTIERFRLKDQVKPTSEPTGVAPDPKTYADKFKFMIVQFTGQSTEPTLPVLEVRQAAPNTNLFDRNVGLSHQGKTMYYRLLLELGNMDYPISGYDRTIKPESYGYPEKAKYKDLFHQKLPGLRDHVGASE